MAKKQLKSIARPKSVREATRQLREVEGQHAFFLDLFGDALAKREGYATHDGIDALHYYLIQKHNWLPRDVRSLNWDDLRFLFAEEMEGWVVPPEFRE